MLEVIEVLWEGPFKLTDIQKLNKEKDYGLYQIYGTHNISGPNTLLYVGQANLQSFSSRIEQHKSEWLNWQYSDIDIYVGRLGGIEKIDELQWTEKINRAEKLLIFFSNPPYNSQSLGAYGEFSNVIVISLGKKNRLPIEVSTFYNDSKYWTSELWEEYS